MSLFYVGLRVCRYERSDQRQIAADKKRIPFCGMRFVLCPYSIGIYPVKAKIKQTHHCACLILAFYCVIHCEIDVPQACPPATSGMPFHNGKSVRVLR